MIKEIKLNFEVFEEDIKLSKEELLTKEEALQLKEIFGNEKTLEQCIELVKQTKHQNLQELIEAVMKF